MRRKRNNLGLSGIIEMMIVLILFFSVLIGVIGYALWQGQQTWTNGTQRLEHDGFAVVDGYLNSPEVMQTTSDYYTFVLIAHQIGAHQVYRTSGTAFVVFAFVVVANETYGCEWYP